jgi:hypothetical protein
LNKNLPIKQLQETTFNQKATVGEEMEEILDGVHGTEPVGVGTPVDTSLFMVEDEEKVHLILSKKTAPTTPTAVKTPTTELTNIYSTSSILPFTTTSKTITNYLISNTSISHEQSNHAEDRNKNKQIIQLRDTSGWDPTRRKINTISTQLEEDNRSQMAFISDKRRLQNTIQQKTRSMETETTVSIKGRPVPPERGDYKIPQSRNHRDITDSEPKLSVQVLHASRRDKTQTDSRLPTAKSICSSRTLQNGRCTGVTRLDRKRRLVVQARSQGCIRRGTYS